VAILKNIGQQDISTPVEITVNIAGQDPGKVTLPKIDKQEEVDTPFTIPGTVKLDNQTPRVLIVKKTEHPIHAWEFEDKEFPITTLKPSWYWYLLLMVLVSVSGVALYYLRYYRHPLVLRLSASPDDLAGLPGRELSTARYLLKRTHRLDSVLAAVPVSKTRLEQAIAFYRDWKPGQQCEYLAERLGAAFEPVQAKALVMFKLDLDKNFLLNLGQCLVLFPPGDIPALDIIQQTGAVEDARDQVCLVIVPNEDRQREFRKISLSADNLYVTPDSKELTTLLLSPSPREDFARSIASQVKVTRISPYQTKGGVDRENVFFGREQLLALIMHRDPANYILVGGRQLGKTSLLKAIKRRYRDRTDTVCHYLALSGADICGPLANALGLPPDTPLPRLVEHIRAISRDQRLLFLIDEADAFIMVDSWDQYKVLQHFRALSEEGRSHFILAGFWKLYQAAALEYQSPLKNFGETLTIEALEPEACRELATRPMSVLDIRYETGETVETLVRETGGRANLIAIICSEMLKKLDMTRRTIAGPDLETAMDSKEVRTSLSGWESMNEGDETANRLDRIVVYATIHLDTFTMPGLMGILKSRGAAYEPEQLKRSMLRLELAYILKREQERYTYRVPLFTKMIRQLGPLELLSGELNLA